MGHFQGADRGTISEIQGSPRLEFNYLQMDISLYFKIMALIKDEQCLETEKIIWKNDLI
jgi:hypothetical protein